jgi:tRNA(fMet)-specific endonuclease VapC
MIVLDTDHLSELQQNSKLGDRLIGRINLSKDREISTTIITFEEQIRGRLSGIRRQRKTADEVVAYGQLAGLIEFYAKWTILPFDQDSALIYDRLKSQKIRIGSMDLRIASIVLVQKATLLSANLRDFQQVPGLLVEDWLHA